MSRLARWPIVVALGELLIDLLPTRGGRPLEEAATFRRAPGGAPANVAVGLARLGVAAAFVGKLGGDPFGRFLRRVLADEGVDVRGLVEDPTARTPLAFVGTDAGGGRSFVFYHEGMADTRLAPDELDRELIARARVFHFGSVTLAAEPSRAATLAAAAWARDSGCLVSFDPNVRLELWDDAARARANILDALQLVQLVKVSGDELEFLTGTPDPALACRALRRLGPSLAVATLGGDGCYYDAGAASGFVPGFAVKAVDALGAGDAFVAGLLAGLAAHAPAALPELEGAVLAEALRLANAVGALATTRYGAIPALPTRAQVDRLLSPGGVARHGKG